MTLKAGIERLIAKGLSGRQAGRLAVQELAALDHGGRGFLTERDVLAIKAALRTLADGADYQRVVTLYEALPLLLCEARTVSQQTERILCDLRCALERYWISARVADLARGCGLAILLTNDGDSAGEVEPAEANPAYWLAELADVTQVRFLEEAYAASNDHSLADLLDLMYRAAIRSATELLAYLEVIAQASAVLGISVPACWPRVPRELDVLLPQRDPQDLLGDVRRAAGFYNEVAKATAAWQDDGCPVLPPLELDELAPDESTVNLLHIRIAHRLGRTGLGDGWWREKS